MVANSQACMVLRGGYTPTASFKRLTKRALRSGATVSDFDETQNPSIAAHHVDLIIRNIRAHSPIRWKLRNVKGHQDDKSSVLPWTNGLSSIATETWQPRSTGIVMLNTGPTVWKIHRESWSLWRQRK